jgi:hypothetical protein
MLEGQLAQCKTQEPDDGYPTMIEIVAWFGTNGRRGKRRSVMIPKDQFYGRGKFGAPISGDQIIGMIHQLRRLK